MVKPIYNRILGTIGAMALSAGVGCAQPDFNDESCFDDLGSYECPAKPNPPNTCPEENQPPEIVSSPYLNLDDKVIAEAGKIFEYPVQAVDPDGDTLVYILKDAPAGMDIDPATGNITWIPCYKQLGLNSAAVSVQDCSAEDVQSFIIDVIYPGQNYSYIRWDENKKYILLCGNDIVPCEYTKERLDQSFEGIMMTDAAMGGVIGRDTAEFISDIIMPIEVRFYPTGGGEAGTLLPDKRGSIIVYGHPTALDDPKMTDTSYALFAHALTHVMLKDQLNDVDDPAVYSNNPYAVEESFATNFSFILSDAFGMMPDLDFFADPRLVGGIGSPLLNFLATDFGIDVPEMPLLFDKIAERRAEKGSVLNLWETYLITNAIASWKAEYSVDTLPAYTASGLYPMDYAPK